jgi:hypothetical protein
MALNIVHAFIMIAHRLPELAMTPFAKHGALR